MIEPGCGYLHEIAQRCKFLNKINSVKAFGLLEKNLVPLGLGEPDFQPPINVIEAIKNAIDDGKNKYTNPSGINQLRMAICKRLCKNYSNISPENVIVTVGGTEALAIVCHLFFERGDEVLIPDPGFPLYKGEVELCEAKPVPYPLFEKNNFNIEIEDIKESITSKTKAIIINSPSNPTGNIIDKSTRDAILQIAEDRNLIVISDEVYDELVYDGEFSTFLGQSDNVIYINSFSKTFAMTGWRLGYIVADKRYSKQLSNLHFYLTTCPPSIVQFAAVEAILGTQEPVFHMIKEFKARRDLIMNEIRNIEGFNCTVPKGAFYIFPSFRYKLSSEELSNKIIKAGVLCTPGNIFGSNGEGHIRFSYATSQENIKRGMEIIHKTTEKLK